jgi:hypothetical protein
MADFGLGGATLASETEKKKFAQNFLKIYRAVHNTILSISGKNRFKIP